jgi:hypothetical protein
MDLNKTISELRAQRDRIEGVIQQLEAMKDGAPVKTRSTRGRKSMGEAERREVSARMKRYWGSWRKARA